MHIRIDVRTPLRAIARPLAAAFVLAGGLFASQAEAVPLVPADSLGVHCDRTARRPPPERDLAAAVATGSSSRIAPSSLEITSSAIMRGEGASEVGRRPRRP